MGCGSSTNNALPVAETSSVAVFNHDAGSPPPSAPAEPSISFAANLGMYGTKKFRGTEAAKYLVKQKLPQSTLDNVEWTKDSAVADKVAAAVLEWAKDHGARAITPAN